MYARFSAQRTFESEVIEMMSLLTALPGPSLVELDASDRDSSAGDTAMWVSQLDATSLPCRGEDPELWFAESPRQLERAKALCVPCPLRDACLQGAIERQEPWGVWGGEIFDHGVVIVRKRSRGRPAKTSVAV